MSKVANAYSTISAETSVKDSSPLELIVLVFDKIFDHLIIGKKELALGETGAEALTKAVDLLNVGLIASLNKESGGQIAENLEAVYLWAIHKIIEARLNKKPDRIDEVVKVLTPIYDGWRDLRIKGIK